jgi:thiol-disulfide isomerase/thioredoxin
VLSRRIPALAGLALTPLLLVACGRDQPAVVGSEAVTADARESAPDISGPTLNGEALDVADLRGRVVVLNSWASWCAPCREEAPAFVALANGSDPEDVTVVGLNVTDDATAAQGFVDEYGLPYPSIVDSDGAILRTIPGVPPSSLPSTVILDREGRIAARIVGGTDAMELGTLIAAVLEGSPTPPAAAG